MLPTSMSIGSGLGVSEANGIGQPEAQLANVPTGVGREYVHGWRFRDRGDERSGSRREHSQPMQTKPLPLRV